MGGHVACLDGRVVAGPTILVSAHLGVAAVLEGGTAPRRNAVPAGLPLLDEQLLRVFAGLRPGCPVLDADERALIGASSRARRGTRALCGAPERAVAERARAHTPTCHAPRRGAQRRCHEARPAFRTPATSGSPTRSRSGGQQGSECGGSIFVDLAWTLAIPACSRCGHTFQGVGAAVVWPPCSVAAAAADTWTSAGRSSSGLSPGAAVRARAELLHHPLHCRAVSCGGAP